MSGGHLALGIVLAVCVYHNDGDCIITHSERDGRMHVKLGVDFVVLCCEEIGCVHERSV